MLPAPTFAALVCAVLLAGYGDAALTDTGPPQYGNANFWVKLSSIMSSEGDITPDFERSHYDYQVVVPSPHATSLSLNLGVDIRKYNVRFPPEIDVEGKKLNYRIIDGNPEVEVSLNKSIGPLDHTVPIIIKDPKPATGFFAHGAANTYNIRVLQPPDYAQVVKASKLKVYGDGKEELRSKQKLDLESDRADYTFKLRDRDNEVTVIFECGPFAKAKKFNGKSYSMDANITLSTSELSTLLLAQCIYFDERWTKGSQIQRTYVLKMKHKSMGSEKVELRALAESAYCEKNEDADRGYVCRALGPKVLFLVEASSASLTMEMVDKRRGDRTMLLNGIPSEVNVNSNDYRRKFELQVKDPLGHKRSYPVDILQPEHCGSDYKCPKGDSLIVGAETARAQLCQYKKCTEADAEHCCEGGSKFNVLVFDAPDARGAYDAIINMKGVRRGKAGSMAQATAQKPVKVCKGVEEPVAAKVMMALEKAGCAVEKEEYHAKPKVHVEKPHRERCNKFKCKNGLVQVKKANQFKCEKLQCEEDDAKRCCGVQQICDDLSCPIGYARQINKKNPTLPLQCVDGINGDCDTTCCQKAELCDSFSCEKPFQLKARPDTINCGLKCTADICCTLEPVCKQGTYKFKCSDGLVLKKDAEEIMHDGAEAMTEEDCCDHKATCDTYNCPGDKLVLKSNAKDLLCRDQDCGKSDKKLCCEAKGTCFGYDCPKLTVLRLDAEKLMCMGSDCSPQDSKTCCEPVEMCDKYECPIGAVLVEKAEAVGCSESKCTDADTWTCCAQVAKCSSFQCPKKYAPLDGLKACKGVKCTVEDDLETCCEEMKLCSKTKCPKGTVLRLDADYSRALPSEAEDECCEVHASCDTYDCPAGYDYVDGADAVYCGERLCTDKDAGLCCVPVEVEKPKAVEKETVSVSVVPEDSDDRCKDWGGGYWCESTAKTMQLNIKTVKGSKESVKKFRKVDVPGENKAAAHVVAHIGSGDSASEVNVWIAYKSDLPYVDTAIRRLEDDAGLPGSFRPLETSNTEEMWL